jgi:serine/threonine-protein kinase
MFLDEARLAARIAHPNVVPTLDVVESDGEVFLVMEYVRGVTLSQLTRAAKQAKANIPPIISVGIVSAILQGLHAAHEATNDFGEPLQLVHRDVSPQNVLVGADGVARLLDFGIAKASGRLHTTRQGKLKGKLSYMAPEQFRNEPISPRTDLYAAAVILWELLTGRRLFHADSEAGTMSMVLNAAVAPPSTITSGLPTALDGVVIRGLQHDPARRFANAREMSAELDACLGVPSTVEIAHWVEQTVGADLRERATRVAAMERAAAEVGDPPSQRDVSSRVDISTVVDRPSGRRATSSPALETEERRHVRTWVVVGCLCVLALVAAVSVGVATPSERETAIRKAVDQAGTTASAGSVATLTLIVSQPSVADLSVEELPVPTASGPGVMKTRRKLATSPAVGSGHVAGPAAASPSADPDCAQPYTTDAKGHVHFKPSCI